jgi:hypothetical protein
MKKIQRLLELTMVSVFLFSVGVMAWAQNGEVSYDAIGPAADTLINAISGGAGTMAIIGAALALLIHVMKLPVLGSLAFKVPSWVRFWAPAAVGAVYGMIEKVNQGSLWGSAVAGAVTVLMSAVTTRRMIETHGGDIKKPEVVQ